MSDTGPMALCLFHCGHLTGGKRETGPVSATGPMDLCLFNCSHLTGEIGS